MKLTATQIAARIVNEDMGARKANALIRETCPAGMDLEEWAYEVSTHTAQMMGID